MPRCAVSRSEETSGIAPFLYENTDNLKETVLDPNSGEDYHVMPDEKEGDYESINGWGRCKWDRAWRLAGGDSYAAFDTWEEAKEWMCEQLRDAHFIDSHHKGTAKSMKERRGTMSEAMASMKESSKQKAAAAAKPLGVCAGDCADERGGLYTYTGMPTLLIAPAARWALMDGRPLAQDEAKPSEAAPLADGEVVGPGQLKDAPAAWVVVYSRSAPSTRTSWRLLESTTASTSTADQALDPSSYDEAKAAQDVWDVQSVAAELCEPDDDTRAVDAVGGGAACAASAARRRQADEHGREIHWTSKTASTRRSRRRWARYGPLRRRGHAADAERRLLVFVATCTRGSQRVIEPRWPAEVKEQAALGFRVASVAFARWTSSSPNTTRPTSSSRCSWRRSGPPPDQAARRRRLRRHRRRARPAARGARPRRRGEDERRAAARGAGALRRP